MDIFTGKKLVGIPTFSQNLLKTIKPDIHQRLFGDLVVDNKITCESLGYSPKYSFSQGIREMVKTYKTSQNFKAE